MQQIAGKRGLHSTSPRSAQRSFFKFFYWYFQFLGFRKKMKFSISSENIGNSIFLWAEFETSLLFAMWKQRFWVLENWNFQFSDFSAFVNKNIEIFNFYWHEKITLGCGHLVVEIAWVAEDGHHPIFFVTGPWPSGNENRIRSAYNFAIHRITHPSSPSMYGHARTKMYGITLFSLYIGTAYPISWYMECKHVP